MSVSSCACEFCFVYRGSELVGSEFNKHFTNIYTCDIDRGVTTYFTT